MKDVYWYTPFEDLKSDIIFMVNGGNTHQRVNSNTIPAHKKKNYINCSLRKPALAGLADGDRLYIVGHGDRVDGYLVADAVGPRRF